MSPSHRTDVKTNPRGVSADEVLKRLHPDRQPQTELIQLPAPETETHRPSEWLWALLYAGPWVVAAGWSAWVLIHVGFGRAALITAGCFWLALLIALVVVYRDHLEAKK